jgi:hypothetical protein
MIAAVVPLSLGATSSPPLRAPLLAAGVGLLAIGALMWSRRRRAIRRTRSTGDTSPEGSAMLQIIPQGDDAFHLTETCGRVVGWVRGATIRVGAFATEQQALDAAIRGDRALDDYLRGGAHRPRTRPETGGDDISGDHAAEIDMAGAVSGQETRMVHDGAYEWVVVGRRPIARLVRPSTPPSFGAAPEVLTVAVDADGNAARPVASGRVFALEFVVPASVAPMTRLTLARVLHRALRAGETPGAGVAASGHPDVAPRADAAPRRRSATDTGTRFGARIGTPTAARSGTSDVWTPGPAEPPPAA